MKKILLIFGVCCLTVSTKAQSKYFTKTGKINFDATAPKSPENIDGTNKNSTCVMDSKTGEIQFMVLMKGFEFERALMMEHFNENYVESNKFPKTVFKGLIDNNTAINYSKDGSYTAKVSGKLTMHGETKDISTEGKLTVKGSKLIISAEFVAILADYKIIVPQLVADKVGKNAKIFVDCTLEPLNK